METTACQLAELERCVRSFQEQYTSLHSPSPKNLSKGKKKDLDEEGNMFAETFSKRIARVVFERPTVEHISKAYKQPGTVFS